MTSRASLVRIISSSGSPEASPTFLCGPHFVGGDETHDGELGERAPTGVGEECEVVARPVQHTGQDVVQQTDGK